MGGCAVIAELISVGTELLLGEILDTNAQYLSAQLAKLGINLHWRVTVGDNLERCREAFRQAQARSEVVIACGGLGPTPDDLTRQALAAALERPLEHSPEAWENIQAYFAARGSVPGGHDQAQALVVPGGKILPNRLGTAPGLYVHSGITHTFLLPGPPNELMSMFEHQVAPVLSRLPGRAVLLSRRLRLAGVGESRVSQILEPLLASANPTLAPYAGLGEVQLRITSRGQGEEEARQLLEAMEERVREALPGFIYGVDGDDLETVTGRLLAARGLTLAVAESCTGGLLGHRLTNVPGSSAYFLLSVVAYADQQKTTLLGVPAALLAADGAVSAGVAARMAEGVRELAKSHLGIGLTGIAGPSGGSAEKPVGLVYLALAGATTRVHRLLLGGNREDVKYRATQRALLELWRLLQHEAVEAP
jgi:nicotinamide-nucleotide amidase